MANGAKRVVINSRERAISNDFNRMQSMVDGARAAQLARLLNDRYRASLPGYTSPDITGGDTPMNADVFGGLMVRVDDPTSLFVDPGVVGVVDPDSPAGLDDDPYKVINDPGLSLAGVLTFLANGGASPRFDLVVADVVEQVLETDSRDIFDPSVGLFTPQSVNKVVAKRLSYSIVRGTAGAGMPAIPNRIVLAVARVPSGALGWADCTFWDVRPLVQERVGSVEPDAAAPYEYAFRVAGQAAIGEAWSQFGGYRAGGVLKVDDSTNLSLSSADFATSNAALDNTTDVGATPVFALFPSGLPRWALYSSSAAPGLSIRAPFGPRGILVSGRASLSDKAKVNAAGYATGVALPTATGFVGTAPGVCLFMAYCREGISTPAIIGMKGSGRRVFFHTQTLTSGPAERYSQVKTATANASEVTWDYATELRDPNTSPIPLNAVALKFLFESPNLQLATGTPAPSATYDQLGYIARNGLHLEYHPIAVQVGDGSDVPTAPDFTTGWMPVAKEDSFAQTFGFAIATANDNAALASSWRYTASTARIVLAGYEV